MFDSCHILVVLETDTVFYNMQEENHLREARIRLRNMEVDSDEEMADREIHQPGTSEASGGQGAYEEERMSLMQIAREGLAKGRH